MRKPSKPFPPVIVPRQPVRPALAVAMALVGVALTGTPVLALGGGAELETCPTWGQLYAIGGWGVVIAVCFAASFAATKGLVVLWQPSLTALTCAFLVACIVTVTVVVAWAATASPTLIAPTPDLPGASAQFE